jgi:hypothetical protein
MSTIFLYRVRAFGAQHTAWRALRSFQDLLSEISEQAAVDWDAALEDQIVTTYTNSVHMVKLTIIDYSYNETSRIVANAWLAYYYEPEDSMAVADFSWDKTGWKRHEFLL